MDLVKGLNPQQQKAVTASDGPVLVLAGPGSGKTRVLTHRVAWLVQQRSVPPWRIMAVTFTNKAAREMHERLDQLLGPGGARSLTLGTFHATCAQALRREAEAAGIPRDYVIFDADDQLRLARLAIRDLNLDDKRYRPQAALGAISRAKNELVPPEAYSTGSYSGEVVKRIYERYQALLAANNALDFDDLLMVTVRTFDQHPDVLARYQERYLHLLVDEFQDTNQAQYALLRQLSGSHHNLFCVADEDQSIYMWRGADYRNVRRLRDDHPDLVTILLEQNYRSTQTILDAAQAIIRHNPDRTDKALFTERGLGPKIVVHEAYDQDDEAQFVVNTIAQLANGCPDVPMYPSGLVGPHPRIQAGDCAVMYRTNAQSRALEDAFIRAGLPYRLVGATRFYARREIKDLIAFLRLIHNPLDGIALARVINVPPRNIGHKTVAALEHATRQRGLSAYEVLSSLQKQPPVPSRVYSPAPSPLYPPAPSPLPLGARARQALSAFLELLQGWIAARSTLTVVQLIERVLQDTHYAEYLRDGSEEGEDRWANVLELRNVAAEYAPPVIPSVPPVIPSVPPVIPSVPPVIPSEARNLADFLADVALVSDVDNLSDNVNAPTLLTLHAAKGLEFPVVFITGLEDGLLPHSRSFDDPEQMAEERRLSYVGLTRAKDRLVLTYAFRRSRYGDSEPSLPSRFLDDIPPELISGMRNLPERCPTDSPTGVLAGRNADSIPTRVQSRFQAGQRVSSAAFGPGLVIESRPDRDDEMVTVLFEGVGLKRLLVSLAHLERLE